MLLGVVKEIVFCAVQLEGWTMSNLCLGPGEKRADTGGLLDNNHKSVFGCSVSCPGMVL